MSAFTQQGIKSIFDRCNPWFKITLTTIPPSFQKQTASDNTQILSSYHDSNKVQMILNNLNTYYDAYENMSNTSNSKKDVNYVWSNKQHIITNNLK